MSYNSCSCGFLVGKSPQRRQWRLKSGLLHDIDPDTRNLDDFLYIRIQVDILDETLMTSFFSMIVLNRWASLFLQVDRLIQVYVHKPARMLVAAIGEMGGIGKLVVSFLY